MGCGSSVPVTAIPAEAKPTTAKAQGGPTDEELSCRAEAERADVAANAEEVLLPVSVHLVRDGSYSLTPADFASDGPIFEIINKTWQQAKIRWKLLGVTEHK